jgi:hypothetical protein
MTTTAGPESWRGLAFQNYAAGCAGGGTSARMVHCTAKLSKMNKSCMSRESGTRWVNPCWLISDSDHDEATSKVHISTTSHRHVRAPLRWQRKVDSEDDSLAEFSTPA